MNRIVSLAFVFSVVLGVGAAIAADAKQAPRNVAVVSLFDDTFHKLQFGLMVFSGEFLEKDVPDWHVAETSEAEMVALLKQKGIGEIAAVLPQPRAARRHRIGIEQPLIQMAREAGFDTLVLIRPKRDEGNFREYVPGYGIGAWASCSDRGRPVPTPCSRSKCIAPPTVSASIGRAASVRGTALASISNRCRGRTSSRTTARPIGRRSKRRSTNAFAKAWPARSTTSIFARPRLREYRLAPPWAPAEIRAFNWNDT